MIGDVIRQRRLVLNMTQAELAEQTGVSAPAVNKWEKGMSCPDVMILPVLARVLRMDMNDLFDFRKEMSVEELNAFIGELRSSLSDMSIEELHDRITARTHEYPGDARLPAPRNPRYGNRVWGSLACYDTTNRRCFVALGENAQRTVYFIFSCYRSRSLGCCR